MFGKVRDDFKVLMDLLASAAWPQALRRQGPGRKTLHTYHKRVGRSRYMPHQGSQERFRRWKRMELKKGARERRANKKGGA